MINNIINAIKIYNKYIIIVLFFFVISFIIGHNRTVDISLDDAYNLNKSFTKNHSSNFFMFIFLQNSIVAFIAMFFSLPSFGVISLFIIILKGYTIGSLVNVLKILSKEAYLRVFFFSILPHGIIEVIALLIASGLGFFTGLNLMGLAGSKYSIKEHFLNLFNTYLYIVIPLLFIAAIIQVYITPIILISF